MTISLPDSSIPIVMENRTVEESFRLFILDVVSAIQTIEQKLDLQTIITGVGSPEGVVSAVIGQEYMDTTGTAGSIKYIKRDADIAGDTSQGWILI